MIYDYDMVALLLFIVNIILNSCPVCIVVASAIWIVFAIRIGMRHHVRLEDMMPRGEE
jgi:uncharacterized membrane protein